VAAASSFGYSTSTVLRIQIAILLCFAVVGTMCFAIVEFGVRKRAAQNSQDASNKEIMKEK
jgi:mannose/fructose/N-acetylgalactosamine-specific phosphotransferase system component IIC